jgi:hypothetical protein
MKLLISERIRTKLASKNSPVNREEIEQCFESQQYGFPQHTRESNSTVPPTLWFISDTRMGRKLKVVFVPLADGHLAIKTTYEPDEEEIRIYNKFAQPL